MRLKPSLVIITLIASSTLFLLHIKTTSADNDPCQQATYDQGRCQDQINSLQQQLDSARGQEKTLKSQLDYIDAQTRLTEAKIEDTNYQIKKLDQEITDLSGRITRVSASVDSISAILLDRIVRSYKYSDISTLDLLFSSHGFSNLLENLEYIQIAQANDKKVLYQLQATKVAYNDQKNDKETRQAQEEKLKKDLDTYSAQLDSQKASKARLLKDTQNSEALYQERLQAALAEQQAISGILAGAGTENQIGPIHQGDVIATVIPGRSACSFGTHLHFGVYQNNSWQNPASFLSNTNINRWDNWPDTPFPFNGNWPWPINQPIDIEQGYGMTAFATGAYDGIKHYGGGPHTGIDMYSESSSSVVAVQDGTLYVGGISCGGGTLHYKKVDHENGVSSYYLHVL